MFRNGEHALIMKPNKVDYRGSQIDAWETVTSAKVEGRKLKSTSPPFGGIFLAAIIIAITVLLFYYIFRPNKQRVVMGVARKRKNDGTTEPVVGAACYIPAAGETAPFRAYGPSQPGTGKFAISHNNAAYSNSTNVEVECYQGGLMARATAYPYIATLDDYGIFGFDTRFATVVFAADSPINLPPQISVDARMLGLGNGDIDTLRETGKVVVNSSIRLKVSVTPLVEDFNGNLYVNGSRVNQLQWTQTQVGTTKIYETTLNASSPGSYSIRINAQTVTSLPATKIRRRMVFLVVDDPNNCSPNPVAPPIVLTDSTFPRQGATQVDVGTKIHFEFSEPVKGFLPGGNIFLTEVGTTTKIGGTISSGGLPVGVNTAKCQIDFTPAQRLKGGKEYKITLENTVKDSEDVALVEEFTRTFKTFQGSVITPQSIPDNSYRIATLDDFYYYG